MRSCNASSKAVLWRKQMASMPGMKCKDVAEGRTPQLGLGQRTEPSRHHVQSSTGCLSQPGCEGKECKEQNTCKVGGQHA